VEQAREGRASAELRWQVREILTLKDWRHYCEGHPSPLTIYTDHESLQYFTTSKALSRRESRWAEFLSDFSFVVIYRPGGRNTVADAMSRRHVRI
jgi:hypothetical protein